MSPSEAPVLRTVTAITLVLALGALALAAAPAPAAAATGYSESTAVVGFAPGGEDAARAVVERLGGVVLAADADIGFIVVGTAEPARFVAAAAREPALAYAERDPLVFTEHTPNDVLFIRQYGPKHIRAPEAWDTEKGDGAIVAVLDTGVDWMHPDLMNRVWTNPDEIAGNNRDDDANGYFDDVRGWDWTTNDPDPSTGTCGAETAHGTHVAGIVAAEQDNVQGVTGVAPEARVMALKMLCAASPLSAAALAIRYAVREGADVVTCSWFSNSPLTAFEQVVTDAYQNHNMIFVKSAGNTNGGAVTYPGTLPEYIAVSSTTSSQQLSSFSAVGAKVELAAPGSGIMSTQYAVGYGELSGTSMAAPHVAGVAALVVAKNPALTNVEVRAILAATAKDLGATGRDPQFGHGLVDAAAALAATPAP